MDLAYSCIAALVIGLLVLEFQNWQTRIVSWIIRKASGLLPVDPHEKERFEEEWLSDINTWPGPTSQLVRAIGCLIGALRIRAIFQLPVYIDYLTYAWPKRVFDIVFSLFGLCVFLPVAIYTVVTLKLEKSGPVFATKKKVGLKGKVFLMLYFRLNYKSPNETNDSNSFLDYYQNLTPRSQSLFDHGYHLLPSLINILKGDMSVIGPAAYKPDFVKQGEARFPNYAERKRIKPGFIGWAQVYRLLAGKRDDELCLKEVELDLKYARKRSLSVDFDILRRSVRLAKKDFEQERKLKAALRKRGH